MTFEKINKSEVYKEFEEFNKLISKMDLKNN